MEARVTNQETDAAIAALQTLNKVCGDDDHLHMGSLGSDCVDCGDCHNCIARMSDLVDLLIDKIAMLETNSPGSREWPA